jgi:hypothetical protein
MKKALFTFAVFLMYLLIRAQTPDYFYNYKGEKEYLLLNTKYAFILLNEPQLPEEFKQYNITFSDFQSENKKYPTNNGKISAIVPAVTHSDHSEHSVKIIVTEYGVADLRGLSPIQRAQSIIENCVHPDYKKLLNDYLNLGVKGHTPHHLEACFAFHRTFNKCGDMRKTNFSEFG